MPNEILVMKNQNYIQLEFHTQFDLSQREVQFLDYFIKEQMKRGLDEWVIIDYEGMCNELNAKRVTLQRWFAKFKDLNILLQEGNRRPLFKINPNMVKVIE